MRTALLALFGFSFFTAVCPITLGAMPMNMGNLPMVSHIMQGQHEATGAMSCEQCKKKRKEIVTSFGAQTEATALPSTQGTFLAFWELPEPLNRTVPRMPLLANAPPIPTETLVGTVILQT